MSEGGFRFEYKYRISRQSAALLERQLSALLGRDAHCDAAGGYDIRSLYFDDWQNSAYYEKIAGEMLRSKYRIRYYNGDPRYIVLECKRRNGLLMQKGSVRLSRAEAVCIMNGADLPEPVKNDPLATEFLAERGSRRLTPRVIVSYRRAAFVQPVSNTRITLDTDVRTGLYRTGNFFDRSADIPVMEPNEAILEVKFDRYLPLYIAELLESTPQLYSANSKYAACLAPCELE